MLLRFFSFSSWSSPTGVPVGSDIGRGARGDGLGLSLKKNNFYVK